MTILVMDENSNQSERNEIVQSPRASCRPWWWTASACPRPRSRRRWAGRAARAAPLDDPADLCRRRARGARLLRVLAALRHSCCDRKASAGILLSPFQQQPPLPKKTPPRPPSPAPSPPPPASQMQLASRPLRDAARVLAAHAADGLDHGDLDAGATCCFASDHDGLLLAERPRSGNFPHSDPPYRIPPERFSMRPRIGSSRMCLDVRHGRVLINDDMRSRWAVLCAAGDRGHVHGACHSSPFKVVAIISNEHDDDLSDEDDDYEPEVLASVYSSETDMWSDLISTGFLGRGIDISLRSTLVGNTLYWLLESTFMLTFDLEAQRAAVTGRFAGAPRGGNLQIIQAEDGTVGFAALCDFHYRRCLEIWDRKIDSYGFPTGVLRQTVELQKILGLESRIDGKSYILHYMEDVQAILLQVQSSVYMIQLESLQPKKLFESTDNCIYRPFTSFYAEEVPLAV
ncbi:uncharacterized protein LOC124662754 [Lolium rigidum]|uniref:uncharacterized protein LOC124662754 n=1 Tax=Lolium rigidum TaxID=89674 RepID=UPI001F5E29D5|nr:uncharacterized protein LOC124662754 [Lolium rigidum]